MGEILYEAHYKFEPTLLIPLIMLISIPILFRNEPKGAKIFGGTIWFIVIRNRKQMI